MFKKYFITICKMIILTYKKKIRFLSKVLVKIFNAENYIFWGLGYFDENANFIVS